MINRIYNRSTLLWGYIIAALCLGYFWYRVSILINSGYIESSILKFGLRFIFGLMYYMLAYVFCLVTNQRKLRDFLTKLYLLFELFTLASGLCRLYIYDSQMVLSVYRTFIKATVSPLAFMVAYVYQSFVINAQRLKGHS